MKNYEDLRKWQFISDIYSPHFYELGGDSFCEVYFYKQNSHQPGRLNESGKPRSFSLNSSLLLPKDSITISFSCRSRQLDTLYLKLNFYRKNEVYLNTLVIPVEKNGENHISLNNVDADVMEAQIFGESLMVSDTVSMQIKNFDIYAKHRDMSQCFNEYTPEIDNLSVVPLPLIRDLDEFQHKKIIGLGESAHGCRDIRFQVFEIIKYSSLEDRNLKLICFELPVDMVMNWNLYVRDMLPENYRYKIMDEIKKTSGDIQMVDLLDDIRGINRKRKESEKIHVVGLDLRDEAFYVFEYLQAYKKMSEDKSFLTDVFQRMGTLHYDKQENRNDMIFGIFGRRADPDSVNYRNLVRMIEENRQLRELMDQDDLRFLTGGFLLNIPTRNDAFEDDSGQISSQRDEYMWKVFQLAMECYAPGVSDRVMIYAHSEHLSRTYNPNSISTILKIKALGCYLADYYGDDYWAVSFHAGEGYYKSSSNGTKINMYDLQEALPGSFEWAADKVYFDRFYCRNLDLDSIFLFRVVGNRPRSSQFYSLSKDRFDGYIYIRETASSPPDAYDIKTEYKRERIMKYYIDSLEFANAPCSNDFNYWVGLADTCVDIRVPGDFTWNGIKVPPLGSGMIGQRDGYFESEDKGCIVIVDHTLTRKPERYYAPNKVSMMSQIESWLIRNFSLKGRKWEPKYQQTRDTLLAKYATFREDEYALQICNADKIAELTIPINLERNPNIKMLKMDYKYSQTIIFEKDGDTISLICFYTDEGYANMEKYRKSIVSMIGF